MLVPTLLQSAPRLAEIEALRMPTKLELVINRNCCQAVRDAADHANDRRRGDRVDCKFAALHMAAPGTQEPIRARRPLCPCPQAQSRSFAPAGSQARRLPRRGAGTTITAR